MVRHIIGDNQVMQEGVMAKQQRISDELNETKNNRRTKPKGSSFGTGSRRQSMAAINMSSLPRTATFSSAISSRRGSKLQFASKQKKKKEVE